MIGTHDSYTFLKPKWKVLEIFSFLWRTQDKNIKEQKALGVQYFDIRVRRDGSQWRVCHGLVDFWLTFNSLKSILEIFTLYKVRLILERGTKYDETLFRHGLSSCLDYPCLSFAAIKKDWKVIVDRGDALIDHTYVPFLSNLTWWENIKRMKWLDTIKHYAKKHTPKITKELIEDTVIHFVDYAN